jgi:phenylpropionate dioxygenase-like ring-hydroxylating dioxygenase large terminal subunit
MIGLSDYWYIACPTARLSKRPLAVTVLEHELVIFRDAGGAARALLDRCAHRGVRLSLGRCEADGTIECPYHGWRYDGAGHCTAIPSQREGVGAQQRIEIPAFPCAERDGYVWVWIGRPGRSPGPVPRTPDFAGRRWIQSTCDQKYPWTMGIENNVDIAHPAFAHPFTHPSWYLRRIKGLSDTDTELRLEENGLLAFAPIASGLDADPPKRPYFMLRFELPDRVRVDFWLGPLQFTVLMHFIPTGERSCRMETCVTNPFYGFRRVSLAKSEGSVPRQDRVLMESVRPDYVPGSRSEYSVAADASTLLARRIVELAANGLWEEKRHSLPSRKIVSARM